MNTFETCCSERETQLVGKLTNGAEAKGPHFKSAMSGSDRVGNKAFVKDDSTACDATACHPTLGWFGSSGAGASTAGCDKSSQLGGVNPVATRFSTLLLMATMLGAYCEPPTASRMDSGTSGWRS